MIQRELQELCVRLEENDPTLTTLNLDYGNIGIDGAKALRDALRHNKIVTSLHLHHANLGFDGTKILFEGLQGRGVKTAVNLVDDYTDEEYNTLMDIVKASDKKKKNSFDNGKGMDNEIFANLANKGRGYKAKDDKENKSKESKSLSPEDKKVTVSYTAESKQNG